ncbi:MULTISPECIES: histidinol-phosphate transaminase [unclassified Paludibacterium]|uniref:histidinol-phosphate transaminase n=1 Tax=unclassified Paludibacterium TaxID=2618429 RepID=UPI00207B0EF2|nr:histidinol-phosphate transaminase [Paludibacterium sp. B53371]BEV71839.1 hypothetical protein THUN1379_13210 [Paludibacterium sp. THUN1379]
MSDLFALRREFISRFDLPIPPAPRFAPDNLAMWQTMLAEEWAEFQQALADYQADDHRDEATSTRLMAELTAEGVDVLNVLVGLLLSQGMPVEAMTRAIHQANLRKAVNGQVVRRADGKVLKPEGWQPADKEGVIRQARQQPAADSDPRRFWSELVHQLTPYQPGEQPQQPIQIKINTNESPYGPAPGVLTAIQAASDDSLRLYPDPDARALKQQIARHHQLDTPQIFVGNSSDEVLATVFQALLKKPQPLLMPDISYGFYPVYCALYGIPYRQVPLDAQLAIRVADYRQPAGAIILANPNAPTGQLLTLDDIRQLLDEHPDQVVVIDEAYIDFGGESAIALLPEHPNLLVVRTLSKSRALAGLRVGYAMGHPALIEALERIKNSFNAYPLDRLAIAGAIASFEDEDYFRRTCRQVMHNREQLRQGLQALGFEVLPSAANFLFVRHPRHDAAALAADLRREGILVRHFRQPRIEQYLRISIGTEAQCARLLDVWQQQLTSREASTS